MKQTTKAHILMTLLVISWGFDYVPAKLGLEILEPMSLLFLKYAFGLVTLLVIKFIISRNMALPKLRDIPVFVACAIFGELIYFYCEYSAMDYLPVALLTIILGFVPVLSVAIERVLYKRRANRIIFIGIGFCILGIIFVIGSDWHIIFQGRAIGYILAFGAVISWNVYNFITASERLEKYDSATLSCTQIICTLLLCSPMAWHMMPPLTEITPMVWAGIAWIGVVDSGLGFLIMVYGLQRSSARSCSMRPSPSCRFWAGSSSSSQAFSSSGKKAGWTKRGKPLNRPRSSPLKKLRQSSPLKKPRSTSLKGKRRYYEKAHTSLCTVHTAGGLSDANQRVRGREGRL